MLAVQKWLIENNGDYVKLNEELGIKVTFKDELCILGYDQLNSPKMHPIVIECRGICLNKDTYELVAKPFQRFFNYGEALEINNNFNWNNFSIYEKMDGSISKIFKYKGKLHIQTRGSFADAELIPNLTWYDAIKNCLSESQIETMVEGYTYIFEYCAPYNQVVVFHPEPKLVLIGVTRIEPFDYEDLPDEVVNLTAKKLGIERPSTFTFKTYKEIHDFVESSRDNVWEGVVLRDNNNIRMKLKSTRYLGLHSMSSNGNLVLAKNLLPFVLAGEKDELLAYFPYVEPHYIELENKIISAFNILKDSWESCKHINDQKEFALKITKENPTPFNSILFNLKKNNQIQDKEALYSYWRDSKDLILEYLGD